MATAEQHLLCLPIEVVLRHVPKRYRLTSCALVSHEWHTAAIAATTSVTASFNSAPPQTFDSDPLGRSWRLKSLGVWLQKHGSVVKSITVEHHPKARQKHHLVLPFHQLTKLTTLKLQDVSLFNQAHGPDHHAAGSWGELTALVCLQLDGVVVGTDSLNSLAALTGLRYLSLRDHRIEMPRNDGKHVGFYCGEVLGDMTSHILMKLTGLTSLIMIGQSMGQSMLASVAALPELRGLYLEDYDGLKAPAVTYFPTTLTRLVLINTRDFKLDFKTTNLGQVSSLVRLHIASRQMTTFDPVLLSPLTNLTRLGLRACSLSGQGVDALLESLLRCSQLEHLDLTGSIASHPAQGSHLSALTSNNQLMHLRLLDCALAPGSVRQIIPGGQQLRSLLELHLGCSSRTPDNGFLLGPGDIDHLVACCPFLEHLELRAAVQPGVQATSLAKLEWLSVLEVSGHVLDDSWIQGSLLQLTQLEALSLSNSDRITTVGVIQLQQMTQLTRLELERVFRDLCTKGPGPSSVTFESAASPPDVWVQFQDWCFHMKTSAKVMWQVKSAEFKEMKGRAASLEQELQKEKQHAADLQKQLAALQLELQQVKAAVGSGTAAKNE